MTEPQNEQVKISSGMTARKIEIENNQLLNCIVKQNEDILALKTDEVETLKKMNERQTNQWNDFLKSKRRQIWIALTLALTAVITLYNDIVQREDFTVIANRIANVFAELPL